MPMPRRLTFFESGYQTMSLGSLVPHASSVRPLLPAMNWCATRVAGGRATTWPASTACCSSPRRKVPAPPRSHPPGVRSRQPDHLRIAAAAECQHVQPALAGDERVRLRIAKVHDAVAAADCVRARVLPAQPAPVEDVEDLLLIGMYMHRH